MRIAIVSQAYPPETAHGGISSQTELKAVGLRDLGHEVHVVAQAAEGVDRTALQEGIHIHRIAGFEAALQLRDEAASWISYSVRVAAALERVHAHATLDVIDFPEWGAEGYVYLLNRGSPAPATAVQLHGPLVMLAHTIGWPDLDSNLYRVGTHMEGTCLRLADLVYSSSSLSADWCADRYGLARDAIPTLHLGVDTTLFRPSEAGLEPERPTIVYVGRVARSKGADVLVDAACRLLEEFPRLSVLLAGRIDPPLEAELRSVIAAAGATGLLEVGGFVGRDTLPVVLQRAHVLAAPSLYEGGPGLALLEAMACGLPVVACLGSGAEAVVREGETGFLVPPSDAPALARALGHLLRRPDERARIGRRCREYVLDEADTRHCSKSLEHLYAGLLASRHAGAA